MHVILAAWYSPANWPYYAIALLALGLVIFVHELGHFLVAKLCGVKCEKFYVGFDPPIKVGWGKYSINLPSALWKKKWGETEYGIGIIPLGGYVKMLGQDDNPGRDAEKIKAAQNRTTANSAEGTADENYVTDPRSYIAQTVPERMAIISAGVIMNLIFAWIFATIAFSPALGVPYIRCDVAMVLPGEAAYQAGILPGDQIIEINGVKKPRFKDLRQEVFLGDPVNGIPITIERRLAEEGKTERLSFALKPKKNEQRLMGIIGISPAHSLKLNSQRLALPKTPAADVVASLQGGDELVQVNGQPVKNFVDYQARLAAAANQTITVTFARKPTKADDPSAIDAGEEFVSVKVAPHYLRRYGLVMKMGPVVAVRPNSPAAKAGIEAGDQIVKVDGKPVGDPLELPEELRKKTGAAVTLEIQRPSKDGPQTLSFEVTLANVTWSSNIRDLIEIPTLGVAYEVFNTVEGVHAGTPAAKADFRKGDKLRDVTLVPANEKQAAKERLLLPGGKLGPQQIGGKKGVAWVTWLVSVPPQIQPDTSISVTVERNGKSEQLLLGPAEKSKTTIANRGFIFVPETGVMQASSLTEAMSFGWRETKYSMLMVYRFLYMLVSGDVSPKLLGGPGTIFALAGMTAKQGPASLLLFLTMLSANLAVINFLPIPVLDGGHMVFLVLEGIFRRPVSEKIVIPLTWAGLFLILALMFYVIWRDVDRFIL